MDYELSEMTVLMSNISTKSIENISTIVFKNPPKTLKRAFDFILICVVVTIMLGMGSTIELKSLWQQFRRPAGIAIGMLSQFLVLPASMFGLAHALQLDDLHAISLLVISCCPGGTLSNIYTYWVDGDVSLGLTMTTLSTVMAVGMMPLNLFIYTRSWTNEVLVIPYINIVYTFLMAFCPAVAEIVLRWKWPNIARTAEKIGSCAGTFSIVISVVMMSVMYPFMYRASWKIYAGASLLSLCGFAFGYLLATVCRITHPKRRTIALETGVQNFPLCMTLLNLTFEKDQLATMALVPLLYGVTVLFTAFLFFLLYKLHVWLGVKHVVNVDGIAMIEQGSE